MNWFKRLLPSISSNALKRKEIPEGLWRKCDACQSVIYRAELERNLDVCPKCNHHMYISARARLNEFLNRETITEISAHIVPVDRLKFRAKKKYKDNIHHAQVTTGEKSALVVFKGKLIELPVIACAFEYKFIGVRWAPRRAKNSCKRLMVRATKNGH